MPSALQVGSVLLGMCLLTMLLKQAAPDYANSRIAIIAVPAIIATAMAASYWWPLTSQLVTQSNSDGALTKSQAAVVGATLEGANTAFFSWVASQIPPHDTYYLIDSPSVIFWASFSLLPRFESSIRNAQWLVLYGVPAASAGAASSLFGPERMYAPGYGIARRR